MISFACPACNKQLKVKDELAGKKGKCPGCGKPVMVPENLAAALSEPGKHSPVPGPAADAEPTFAPKAPALPADADARTLPPNQWEPGSSRMPRAARQSVACRARLPETTRRN